MFQNVLEDIVRKVGYVWHREVCVLRSLICVWIRGLGGVSEDLLETGMVRRRPLYSLARRGGCDANIWLW